MGVVSRVFLGEDVRELLRDVHPDVVLGERFWREFDNAVRVVARRCGESPGEVRGLVWVWAFVNAHQLARSLNKAGWGGFHLRLRDSQRAFRRSVETPCGLEVGRELYVP